MSKQEKASQPSIEQKVLDNDMFEGFEGVSVKSDLSMDDVSDSIGLKSISIRMQQDLLEELKMIAGLNGLGYQSLIKQQLRRFVDAEMRSLLRQQYSEKLKIDEEASEEKGVPSESKCA